MRQSRGLTIAHGSVTHPDRPLTRGLTASRGFDRGDVDLRHLHHRIERPLCSRGIRIRDRFRQRDGRYLPRKPPFVLAPPTRAFLTAIADDRVPVAVRFCLV